MNLIGGYYGTALQAATGGKFISIVKTLIAAGADVNVQGGKRGTAIEIALKQKTDAIIKILLEAGARHPNPEIQSRLEKWLAGHGPLSPSILSPSSSSDSGDSIVTCEDI